VPDDLKEALTPTEVVLDELDELAARCETYRTTGDQSAYQRCITRRKIRVGCEIWYFEDKGRKIQHQKARTRNLSERGVGLIAKCVVLRGVPIEIRIALAGHSPVHLAGIVAFCRHARRGYHEIGVELKVHQDKPIFVDDPAKAMCSLPWLQGALMRIRLGRKPIKFHSEQARRC
jgi:hypothetical protein